MKKIVTDRQTYRLDLCIDKTTEECTYIKWISRKSYSRSSFQNLCVCDENEYHMSPLNFFESNSLKFKFQGRRRRFQNILNGDKNKIYFIFINIEPIPREMRSIKDLFIFSFLSFGNFEEFWDHKSSQNEDIWAQNVCRVIMTISAAKIIIL